MHKIIIVTSKGKGGGHIALALLCKLLIERGYDAKVYYVHDFPDQNVSQRRFWRSCLKMSVNRCLEKFGLPRLFRRLPSMKLYSPDCDYTPLGNLPEKIFPFFNKKKTIVVYPEVVYGNFLRAKNVVRWLLFKNRYKDMEGAFGKDDLVICYRQFFNDWDLNPEGYQVRLAHFDSSMYRQYNFEPRSGNCYLIRKGRTRTDLPAEFDGPVIDYSMWEKDIVDIFNTCKYCYLYDTQTFYAKIAAVCGCIPIVVMEPGKSREDYLGETDTRIPGVAYGDSEEEIMYAVSTRDELLESLDYTKMNGESIDVFIKAVKEKFKSDLYGFKY